MAKLLVAVSLAALASSGSALRMPKLGSLSSTTVGDWMCMSDMCFVTGANPARLAAQRGPAACSPCRHAAGAPFVKAARSPLALRMTEADAAAAPAFTGDVKAELTKALALEDATKVATAFSDLKSKGGLKKWNNQAGLKSRAVSQNELKRALKTEKNLDELLGLVGVQTDLKQLTIAAFAFSAVVGVGGSIIGGQTGGAVYWITYLGAAAPLVLIGVGSVAPGLIGGALAKAAWAFDETNTKERRIKHEAAHLLAGYLCGLPIEAYALEPSPACYFYDREEGNIDDVESWKKARPFNDKEIDTLSVVSMSGLMGELTTYDKADGGQGDLEQLEEFFFRAESEALRKPAKREDQTRWGALESLRIINNNKNALDAVCKVMASDGSVEDCILAIENAADAPAPADKW